MSAVLLSRESYTNTGEYDKKQRTCIQSLLLLLPFVLPFLHCEPLSRQKKIMIIELAETCAFQKCIFFQGEMLDQLSKSKGRRHDVLLGAILLTFLKSLTGDLSFEQKRSQPFSDSRQKWHSH
eukprot:g27050.t1